MATKTAVSNVDIIRRYVYERQPVGLDEIAAELKSQMSSIRSDEIARKNAQIVLEKNPYFHLMDGRWEIKPGEMPEYKVLADVLREAHQVLYERDVKSKVAQKLGMKVANVVLDLFRADGVQKFGSRWGLKGWVVANDQAAEVLGLHPGGLSEKDLLKHVSERAGLDPAMTIFNFTGDKRFVAERKLWMLKEHLDKKKEQQPKAAASPKKKKISLDEGLETGFLQAQVSRAEAEEAEGGERLIKSRLRKANIKVAQEIVEAREDLAAPKQEDFAARLSQVLSAAGMDEYGVRSFQRVESAAKERGLNTKERDEINQFISQLMEQDTVGVGQSPQSVANAPLSARKMQDVLRLKYLPYTRDRVILPTEYYRFLIELLRPTVNMSTVQPSCMEGMLAVELFTYLYERLEDAAWALTDDDSNIEIVQRDGARYRLSSQDAQLIEQARDRFIVSQVDVVNHYLNNRYTGIEADKVLARAARVITRLSGFENAYIVSRDFLSELPEVFGYQHDEENLIPDVFEMVLGNYTFTQDPNLAANYLDQSLKILSPTGRLGVFVLTELPTLLKEHGLLGDFLRGMAVTHFIRLPLVDGRHKVVLLLIEALGGEGRSERPIVTAEVEDLKSLSLLLHALRDGGSGEGLFKTVEAHALGTLIT